MSDLTFNKIAGAVLATGLAIFLLREVSDIVFEHEELEKPGYAIAVAEAGGGEEAGPELPPDWGTLLPVANIEAGKAVSAKCASCHNFEAGGANGTGPDLYGVVGRKPGSHPGFAYSDAMEAYGAAHPQWTFDELNDFLAGPQKYISGTKMTFVGLKKQEDRVAMIAYLQSLGSSLAIPAPNPPPAAADSADEPTTIEEAPGATGQTDVQNQATPANAG